VGWEGAPTWYSVRWEVLKGVWGFDVGVVGSGELCTDLGNLEEGFCVGLGTVSVGFSTPLVFSSSALLESTLWVVTGVLGASRQGMLLLVLG
jgi:hypothetical protein